MYHVDNIVYFSNDTINLSDNSLMICINSNEFNLKLKLDITISLLSSNPPQASNTSRQMSVWLGTVQLYSEPKHEQIIPSLYNMTIGCRLILF